MINKVDIKKITEDLLTGSRFWVCDFRFKDYTNKPIRLVRPTYVEVVSNAEINSNGKSIYYSKTHLRPVNSKGVVTSKIIPIYDNTGYRCYTGEPLKVFFTKEDCIEEFKQLVLLANDTLKETQLRLWNSLENRIQENLSMLTDLDNL